MAPTSSSWQVGIACSCLNLVLIEHKCWPLALSSWQVIGHSIPWLGLVVVSIVAGVYTDNQPDFSWLEPGETKTFSQFW